jgi:hypothetical protein
VNGMKNFYVDFEGFLKVKADTKEEAKEKFWNWFDKVCEIDIDCYDVFVDIDCIEILKDYVELK